MVGGVGAVAGLVLGEEAGGAGGRSGEAGAGSCSGSNDAGRVGSCLGGGGADVATGEDAGRFLELGPGCGADGDKVGGFTLEGGLGRCGAGGGEGEGVLASNFMYIS